MLIKVKFSEKSILGEKLKSIHRGFKEFKLCLWFRSEGSFPVTNLGQEIIEEKSIACY